MDTTTYTLRDAIADAINEHGDASLWSDGGTNWTLDNFTDDTAAADLDREDGSVAEMDKPATYDGIHIYLRDSDTDVINAVAHLALVTA